MLETISELENKIINDSEFIEGINWGNPRPGHPEGKVLYHIKDVLSFIEPTNPWYSELRLIALIHDTFKYKVDNTKHKVGENHHAYIARKFAEKYISDIRLLEIIELHDEAYNIYRSKHFNKKRYESLIQRLINCDALFLFLEFYRFDNSAGDKTSDDLIWFKQQTLKLRIQSFLDKYAVKNPNYIDEDDLLYTGPDADEFYYILKKLNNETDYDKIYSSWESGCYQPYQSKEGRYIHNQLVNEINSI